MAMNLAELTPAEGAIKKRKRAGRGHAAGRGKTCGRGHKGMGARAGSKQYVGFEGGQMPLQRRVPKRGFHNRFRTEYRVVNVGDIAALEADEINPEVLRAAGLIKGRGPIKILGQGEISRVLRVTAHAFSKSAAEKISGAGGSTEVMQ